MFEYIHGERFHKLYERFHKLYKALSSFTVIKFWGLLFDRNTKKQKTKLSTNIYLKYFFKISFIINAFYTRITKYIFNMLNNLI